MRPISNAIAVAELNEGAARRHRAIATARDQRLQLIDSGNHRLTGTD
jgi:hypothetical protein